MVLLFAGSDTVGHDARLTTAQLYVVRDIEMPIPREGFSSHFPSYVLHDMPRNHHSGGSTLRNCIRNMNKACLRIHHGNLEDEEKHHLTYFVAGVNADVSSPALLTPFPER